MGGGVEVEQFKFDVAGRIVTDTDRESKGFIV
jgi:hypothetical protein